MVVHNQDTDKDVIIHVSVQDHSVLVENSLTVVKDKTVFVDVFNSKIIINVNTNMQTTKLTKDESAWLYINTEGFGIKVRFYKKHLDMFFTKTSGLRKKLMDLLVSWLVSYVVVMIQSYSVL